MKKSSIEGRSRVKPVAVLVGLFVCLTVSTGHGADRVDPIGSWSCLLYGPPGLGDERLLFRFDPDGGASIARLDSEASRRWAPIASWEQRRGNFTFADPRTGRQFEADLDREALGGRWSTAASRGGWWCTPYTGDMDVLPVQNLDGDNPVMPPLVPTSMGTPYYPRQAIRLAKEGRAVVCFEVDSNGVISSPEFIELSDEIFRLSTLGALQRSRYRGWDDPNVVRPACRSFQYHLDSIF